MNKILLIIIALLLLVISTGAYNYIFLDKMTASSEDQRTAIHLSATERHAVLLEMRSFLSSLQQITSALPAEDMALIIQSAKHSGMTARGNMPETLGAKLPMAFKKLGHDTHIKFDQLALDADGMGDKNDILEQLSTLMQNCVACHKLYRIEAE
ncbi:MAG: cytochrome c [Thiotrichaceae bacterium]|nr:cytochrome c [Thiotrichaceae bacterium]